MANVLDHLVVLARTLEQGAEWCQKTLGVAPTPGGRHPAMSTHNALVQISSERYPRTYLEILAVDPEAPPPGRRRWFDADDEALTRAGPRLVGFAMRTDDIENAAAELFAEGFDLGPVVAAARATARGLLEWKITIREDGHRVRGGTVPTLIQWGDVHPTDTLPDVGVRLVRFDWAAVLQAPVGKVVLTL